MVTETSYIDFKWIEWKYHLLTYNITDGNKIPLKIVDMQLGEKISPLKHVIKDFPYVSYSVPIIV